MLILSLWLTIILIVFKTESNLGVLVNGTTQFPNRDSMYLNVAVFYTRDNAHKPYVYETNTILHCGGFLITPQWVVTSAMCPLKLSWRCLIGAKSIRSKSIPRKSSYELKSLIFSYEANLMLVKLNRSFELDVNLPKLGSNIDEIRKCFVVSWTPKDNRYAISKQIFAYFKKISAQNCRYHYYGNDTPWRNLNNHHFCLEQLENAEPVVLCPHDIGAPVVCEEKFVGVILEVLTIPSNESQICKNYAKYPRQYYSVSTIYPNKEWIDYFVFTRTGSRKFNRATKLTFCRITYFVNMFLIFNILYNLYS